MICRADLAANRLAIYHYEQQTERKIYTVGSKLDVPTTRGDPPNQEVLSYLSFITAAEGENGSHPPRCCTPLYSCIMHHAHTAHSAIRDVAHAQHTHLL
jgi:hypothetical protein